MDSSRKPLQESPFAKASFISKLFFAWTLPLFRKGRKKELELDDLYDVVEADKAGKIGDVVEKKWEEHVKACQAKGKEPSLISTLFKIEGMWFLLLCIPNFIGETVFRIAAPVLLRELIKSFGENSTISRQDQLLYATGVSICPFFIIMLYHPSAFEQYRIAMRAQLALSSLIYRKTLRLSTLGQRQTNVGAMVNLLSNDVNRLFNVIVYFVFVPLGVIQLIGFTILLYFEFGLVGLSGVGLLLLLLPLQHYNLELSSKFRLQIGERSDERSRIMNEIVTGIRILKMYTWEKPFSAVIHKLRKLEMIPVRNRLHTRGIFFILFSVGVKIFVFVTILAYILEGNELSADKVFFASALFNTLSMAWLTQIPMAVSGLGEVNICLKRIKNYLLLDEKTLPSNFIISSDKPENQPSIILDSVSAKWEADMPETLSKISTSLSGDKIVIIVGACGSGKSSLLNVILGELPILPEGKCYINGSLSYAGQESWIFPGTIKENILFGRSMNKEKYDKVCEAAALVEDFKQFAYQDNTLVGERGVALSGGQKARVNLARCLYSDSNIVLLDDPLSAVDSKVSRHLFENTIAKYLSGKLRILVTHQLNYLKDADHIIVLNHGKILAQGTFEDLENENIDFISLLTTPEGDNQSVISSRKSSVLSDEDLSTHLKRNSAQISRQVSTDKKLTDDDDEEKQKMKEEGKESGSVGWQVYFGYFKMAKSPILLILTIVAFVEAQIALSGSDWFLAFWTNDEEKKMTRRVNNDTTIEDDYLGQNAYIYIYSGIIAIMVILCSLRSAFFFIYSIRMGVNMHDSMFSSLVRAKVKFFDDNPSGRILNRFGKDINTADELLPPYFFDMIIVFTHMFGSLAVIVVSNYYMAPFGVLIAIILGIIRLYYVSTARAIKRIEGVCKSPVFTHSSSSFNGLITIRALNGESSLIGQFNDLQDQHSSPWFLFTSTSRCFGIYVELISVIFIAITTFSFILVQDSVKVGDIGLAVSTAMTISGELQWALRLTAEVESYMTSIERCLEYSVLPSEAPLESDENKKPPKDWPNEGGLTFENVSLSYNDADDDKQIDVLKQLNFEVRPKEKIAIVGRTGAGKSTIISALFRLTEPRGHIFIDDLKINDIGLADLRSKISIIPQDPILFSGTIRYNLDPFNEYSDDQLWSSLKDVEMQTAVPSLDFKVADGGANFSVGQRQLICMARAILRKNKILALDEITANIDIRTDRLIQETLASKFKDCTIITVAHRIFSIIGSDKILVLDRGEKKQFDHPHILLESPGIFTEMVNHTGRSSSALLKKLAAESYHGQQTPFLVDEISNLSMQIEMEEGEEKKPVGEEKKKV